MVTSRRSPPQGGLPALDAVGGAVVEIACDESGFSGTNLLDAATPVFTQASVDLSTDEAAELVRALRDGSRSSSGEAKSGQLLRGPQAAEAVAGLLAALRGRAHVVVVDKEYFLVTRIVDLFLSEPTYATGARLARDHRPALALYGAGRAGSRDWGSFLGAFVALVRTTRRHEPSDRAVARFLRARDSLAGVGGEAEDVLGRLSRTRVRAVVTRLSQDDRSIPPPLEPMLPALAETVLFWSAGRRRVLVVHDEQSALTADRLRRLQEVLAHGRDSPGAGAQDSRALPVGASPLAGLVTIDSRDDPRVQVADLLAGVARRSAGTDDDRLHAFLSPTSLRAPKG